MYHKIYDFCKVRNNGTIYSNEPDSPTPRVNFLTNLIESEGFEYEIDKFPVSNTFGYNIILKGTSEKMVIAHHDIVNPNIDNANDNSASVINVLALKKLVPELNVVIVDGEECGGKGSQRLSELINSNYFNKIKWVLNLELTGRGGKYFFIGDYPGELTNHIKSIFNCPIVSTPYNDSVTLRKNGIDSVVINPLPVLLEGKSKVMWKPDVYLDYEMLYNCHSTKDTVDTICVQDMKDFVETVLLKIVK